MEMLSGFRVVVNEVVGGEFVCDCVKEMSPDCIIAIVETIPQGRQSSASFYQQSSVWESDDVVEIAATILCTGEQGYGGAEANPKSPIPNPQSEIALVRFIHQTQM